MPEVWTRVVPTEPGDYYFTEASIANRFADVYGVLVTGRADGLMVFTRTDDPSHFFATKGPRKWCEGYWIRDPGTPGWLPPWTNEEGPVVSAEDRQADIDAMNKITLPPTDYPLEGKDEA